MAVRVKRGLVRGVFWGDEEKSGSLKSLRRSQAKWQPFRERNFTHLVLSRKWRVWLCTRARVQVSAEILVYKDNAYTYVPHTHTHTHARIYTWDQTCSRFWVAPRAWNFDLWTAAILAESVVANLKLSTKFCSSKDLLDRSLRLTLNSV